MAERTDRINPTAANILSSLGIKGATVSGNLPGYVPVLNGDGKLDQSLLPSSSEALAASMAPLKGVCFVDPGTEAPAGARTGSAAAPFASLSEAAASFACGDSVSFALSPGLHAGGSVVFPVGSRPLSVYVLCAGECEFSGALTFSGFMPASGAVPHLSLRGARSDAGIRVIHGSPVCVSLYGSSVGSVEAPQGSSLYLSADSSAASTTARTVLLESDGMVANTSMVPGSTARDAADRLWTRKVRLARVTAGSSGFDVHSSYEDVSADSAGGFDVFDLRARDAAFADGVNGMFAAGRFGSIRADSLEAGTVSAGTVEASGGVKASWFEAGGYRLGVDEFGYVVVLGSGDSPPEPPESVILLRDDMTGAVYVVGVASGRMYIEDADRDSSDSSDSSGDPWREGADHVDVVDDATGDVYELYVSGGELKIRPAV